MPSVDSRAVIEKEAPSVNYKNEHAKFIDYWIAQPGQKGVKSDWEATWRNWMRREEGYLVGKVGKPTPEQRARTTLSLATDIDMRELSA
jgi:hypothetical protein